MIEKLLPNVFEFFLKSTAASKILPLITEINLPWGFLYWKCKPLSTLTFDFEITVNESGSTYKVDYIGDRDDLSRSNSKLLDITLDALYQTEYIPEFNNGKAIESVIKQPITLPRGVCQ